MLRHLSVWPREPRGLYFPMVLLQQFPSPLGLSLHGSTVALPVSTSISCIREVSKDSYDSAIILDIKPILKLHFALICKQLKQKQFGIKDMLSLTM